MKGMRRHRSIATALILVLAASVGASCSGGTHTTVQTPTTSTRPSPTLPATVPMSPTTTAEPVRARAAVNPDQGGTGTVLTFTVAIRGPGSLRGEGVSFGDGGSSGANAGDIACGATNRADHTSTYTHAYTRAGTYQFSDQVTVQAPPPACSIGHTTARLTVIVAAPLSEATYNGAFVSPTDNIGCYIDPGPPGSLRCATFSPPRLVTMDASGSIQTCSGSQCELGNPAMETPVLPYGSATAGGPFQCLSTQGGMICTVVGHKGFQLSRSGVQTIG